MGQSYLDGFMDEAEASYRGGTTLVEIARDLLSRGVGRDWETNSMTLSRLLKRRGVTIRRVEHGEQRQRNREVIRKHEEGIKQIDIAKQAGISPTRVWQILKKHKRANASLSS